MKTHVAALAVSATVLFSSTAFLSACAVTPEDSGSATKYGFLASRASHLRWYESGRTIRLCGPHQDYTRWAINVWAAAIDRSFSFTHDCTNPDIMIYDRSDSLVPADCEAHFGSNSFGMAFARVSTIPMQIVDCGQGSDEDYRKTYLHEVGHLWGLCDQYGDLRGCAVQTTVVPGSVMHSAVTDYLTADDVAGIRALTGYLGSGRDSIVGGSGGSAGGGTGACLTSEDNFWWALCKLNRTSGEAWDEAKCPALERKSLAQPSNCPYR